MSAIAEKMELAVTVEGSIISSNFTDFQKQIKAYIDSIKTDLKTSEDFGQAELDVKKLKELESSISTSKAEAIGKMEAVSLLLDGIDGASGDVRDTRLHLASQIKTKKAEYKEDIENSAVESIDSQYKEDYRPAIQSAMKGKKLEKLQDYASDEAGRINEKLEANRLIINDATLEHGNSIAPDTRALMKMDEDALREQLERRVELAKAETERKRLEAEAEKAKAELAEIKRKEAKAAMGDPVSHPAQEQMPEPQKVGTIPTTRPVEQDVPATTPEGETRGEEEARFIAVLMASFKPVKEARLALKHPENIKAAKAFAESLKAAWTTLIAK